MGGKVQVWSWTMSWHVLAAVVRVIGWENEGDLDSIHGTDWLK